MPLFPLAFLLQSVPGDPGWSCKARTERAGIAFNLDLTVGAHVLHPESFEVRVDAAGAGRRQHSFTWRTSSPPQAPDSMTLAVPADRGPAKASARFLLPDGREVGPVVQGWLHVDRGENGYNVQLQDAGVIRQLWAAGSFRLALADRRGRPIAALDLRLPDAAEMARVRADLRAAADEKARDPARRCGALSEDAWI